MAKDEGKPVQRWTAKKRTALLLGGLILGLVAGFRGMPGPMD
jgi:hypothetical protein